MEDAEHIFTGLSDQVSQSFDFVDKAYGYLSRARREIETAGRRVEESRDSLNAAVGRFGQRMRDLQRQFDPDNATGMTAIGPLEVPGGSPPDEPREPAIPSPILRDDDYADPVVSTRATLDRLFEPRRANESDADYEERLDAQRQWLDGQGVFRARREREAYATVTWNHITGNQQSTAGGPLEPGDDGPDDERRNEPPRDPGRTPCHPSYPMREGVGRGRGGARPGGDGPPGGDYPNSSDESSSTSDDSAHNLGPSSASRRHVTIRTPSCMPEQVTGRVTREARMSIQSAQYHPETNDVFMRESLRWIRRMIREKLGEQLPENAALKNVKNLPTPDKYGGEDDIELFEGWFKALLRWLRFMQLGGTALNEERTQIMGLFLRGKAFDWFNDTIDSSLVRGPPWGFIEAVCAMFERFLHHANAGLAADKFYSVAYAKDTGVHGLWDDLVKYAARMPQAPDDYTFARKFAAALPADVGVPLFRNKNVTIEGKTPRTLYDMAVQQEHNNKQANFYQAKVSSARISQTTVIATADGASGLRSTSDPRTANGPPRVAGQASVSHARPHTRFV